MGKLCQRHKEKLNIDTHHPHCNDKKLVERAALISLSNPLICVWEIRFPSICGCLPKVKLHQRSWRVWVLTMRWWLMFQLERCIHLLQVGDWIPWCCMMCVSRCFTKHIQSMKNRQMTGGWVGWGACGSRGRQAASRSEDESPFVVRSHLLTRLLRGRWEHRGPERKRKAEKEEKPGEMERDSQNLRRRWEQWQTYAINLCGMFSKCWMTLITITMLREVERVSSGALSYHLACTAITPGTHTPLHRHHPTAILWNRSAELWLTI